MPLSLSKSRSRSKSKSKSPQPTDPHLYARVVKRVKARIPTHSAYRSGLIVQEYKKAFRKLHPQGAPYKGKRPTKSGLTRWFKEEWRNQRGGVGYAKAGDVYRPTKRITSKTPITYRELSKKRLRKASRTKRSKGRVSRF